MSDRANVERESPMAEAIIHPLTAVPAVLRPDAENYESWALDDLMRAGAAGYARVEQRHLRWITLGRQNIEDKLDVGQILSIAQERVKDEREWCALQGEYRLKRTTVWEFIQAYRRSAAAGHTKQKVAANHETWTGVLITYGVVKDRRKKQSMPVPAQAEPVDEDDSAIGQVEAMTTGPLAGQDDCTLAIDRPADAVMGTAPIQAERQGSVGHDEVAVVAEIETPVDAELATASTGTAPGVECCRGDKTAAKALKAKKVDPKDQGEPSPCEIDAANNLLKVAGTWDRAMHVIETLKNVVGG